jgi:pilus assembly protein CpaC
VLNAANAFNTRTTVQGTQASVNNLFGGFQAGRTDVNVLLDALENQGLVTVLAEPNLSAISGEPASFLAGGEFPIPVPQGNNTISIDFKKFGVSLNFVATIASGNRINLHVQPEVSELSSSGAIQISGINVPALTTRRAETTIELSSGQSFAVAGLLQNNVNQNINKFPWLGDVPVLGTLFRSNSFQRGETELVIIVTPYIVRPTTTANRLLLPTDGYITPSDERQLLNGDMNRPQFQKQGTAPASRGGSGLIGPAGFDLE